MKKYLLFLTFFVLLANVCYSQNKKLRIYIAQEEIDSIMALVKPKYKWMGTEGLTVTDKLKMKYRKPKGFRQDGASECLKGYPGLEYTFYGLNHRCIPKTGSFFLAFVLFIFQKTIRNCIIYIISERSIHNNIGRCEQL